MIFVILGGVVDFDFSRILKTIDELVEEQVTDGKDIIAQRGHSKYIPLNYDSFDFVDGNTFDEYIKNADLIITHGGVASLISAMKMEKRVIAFPRLGKYKEHLDDHQTEITSVLSKEGYILYATDKDQLKNCIIQAEQFTPKKFVSDNSLMSKLITDFIDSN